MTVWDYTIVGIYFILMILIGMYYARRASGGLEAYFVAGRSLPWWVIALGSVAAYSSAGTGAAFTMLVFQDGLVGNWWWWTPWVIWMPLVAVIWAKLWRRLGIVTAAELIETRYSGRLAGIFRSLYALFFAFGFATISLGYITGWLLRTVGPILGWSHLEILVICGVVVLAYTIMAGLYGVVYSDVVQFLVFLAGNIVFIPIVLIKVGGFNQAYAGALASRGPEFFDPLPPSGDIAGLTLFALIVQGMFWMQSPSGGEGHTAQRFLAAKNEFHAIVGQLANAFLSLGVRAVPFIILGVVAAGLYPETFEEPGTIWSLMVRTYAPVGIVGLLVAAELSAFMSTVDIQMNWGSSYVVNDFYKRFIKPDGSQKHFVWVGRLISLIMLVTGFTIAYFLVDEMKAWFLFINSVMVAFVLPLGWLRFFWYRMNIYGEMAAILLGIPVGYIIWFVFDFAHQPFWQGFLLLFGSGWITIVVITLLTKPEELDTLKKFYRRCRPPGFWKPVTEHLPQDEQAGIVLNLKQDLLDSGIAILAFAAMVVMINGFAAQDFVLGCVSLLVMSVGGGLLMVRWSKRGVFAQLKEQKIRN